MNILSGLGVAAFGGYSLYKKTPDYRSAFTVSEAALKVLKAKHPRELSPREACQELASYTGPLTEAARKQSPFSADPISSREFLVETTDCRDQDFMTKEYQRCGRLLRVVHTDSLLLKTSKLKA